MEPAPFCREADASATARQRRFFRTHLIQLVLVVLAALVAALPSPPPGRLDFAGVVAAALFAVGLVLRVMLVQRGDEEGWYAARRAAESAKSLCYRYAFGATGFERGGAVEARFFDEFGTLGADVLLDEPIERADGYTEITGDMASVRALSFDEARRRYFAERIEDQERWFTARSLLHLRRARLWLGLMLTAEVGGLLLGILKATGQFGVDLGGFVGVMSALAAAFLAWSQLRQHSTLAGAYRAQAVALRAFARRLPLTDEEDWPAFVAQVEASLLAEHSRWQSLIGFGR